ncbi:NAD-dependent epimerase/dehydratase family protein [Actinoplanes nipponensis]|uniref:NAD-dependent epimerase/dehydratase family protein n=1 Tax=Actinoplanes nipponensis TaxID=135950 RepID=UPI001944DCF1|nr:NAD(P)-dependent oxidoreductase [Actinoplanes nipponensis]
MTRDAVLITGGGGRLGSALARRLAAAGHAVTAVDLSFPSWLDDPALPVRCVQADVLSAGGGYELHRAIADCGVVVHLAGLHGLHLRQGASVADLWRSNVESARRVTAAAVEADVRRMVLASTTAVYGPGSAPGEPAAILDEARAPQPDNPYATAKLAAESVMATAAGAGIEVVSLRLGRFFREDEQSYQIRKLSTGLDLEDAIDAMEAVCVAEQVASGVYCVASDLPLSRADRYALGENCHAILESHLPGFVAAAALRDWQLPAQVGRSVDSSKLQTAVGYRPRRSLARTAERWRAEASRRRQPPQRTTMREEVTP